MDREPAYSGSEEDVRESEAPGTLEMVRRFVNTLEVEDEIEHFDTVAGLRDWLGEWELPSSGITGADLVRAVELREALRTLIAAPAGEAPEPGTGTRLNEALAGSAVRMRFDRAGSCELEPAGKGLDVACGLLAAAVRESMIAGTWERLKICSAHACGWAYYDRSRNHSRTWCRMQECGNRAKVRAFRERRSRA